jgi:LacI family transcriptional regulator
MTFTMKRVAAELGVSITTVSKVLNNQPDIGSATRARVLKKVEELGYRPNAVARSLTLRRTHTLGIVIPDLMHSFFVEVIAGLESVVSARGYALLLCSSGEDAHKERRELEALRQRQVDALVFASAHATAATGNEDLLRQMIDAGKCVVMIDRDDRPGIPCHRVLTDDEHVGWIATSHLTTLGHRAIAHIAGPPIAHAKRREQGYRQALRDARIAVGPEWIQPAGFLERDGHEAMRRLLTVHPRITAVFAANDPTAIGAMKAIWDAGLRVPEDIAVVGAGDIAHGDVLRVPLTTVSWSRQEMGTRAAELILEQVEGLPTRRFQRVVIPPRLVVRGSCGGSPSAENGSYSFSRGSSEKGYDPFSVS